MKETKEQLQAIKLSGTNIIVSAGAGSGKTAVLSKRVLEKVKNGLHLNELLILTFTTSAASEMKERIKKLLKKDGFFAELELVDSSYITTFDSFALSIVKKYHYLLNIPKQISPTNEVIENLQKRKILTTVLEEFYQEKNADFIRLVSTLCVKDDNNLVNELLKLIAKLEIRTDLEDFLEHYEEHFIVEDVQANLINAYEQLLKEKILDILDEIEENRNYFDSFYEQKLLAIVKPLTMENEINNLIAKIKVLKLPALSRGADEETKNAKEKINKKVKEVKNLTTYGSQETIVEDFQTSQKNVLVIISILIRFFDRLNDLKRTLNIYSFNDIAKLSLKLIKENSSIQKELKTTFKEIMVDEYQDTSDLQEEFIRLIDNHNIYMVGDIKQSIYRFRGTNPTIFKNKYDAYTNNQNGLKIDLLKNFRSRKEVLDNINLIFNKVMDDTIGNANYQQTQQMVFGNVDYDLKRSPTQNYNMDILEYTFNPSFSKDEIEIFTIAQDILEKIENKYLVYDKETKELREATYHDFVIIMDRNKTFTMTKKIFEYLGIPLALYKDEELNDSQDIYLIKNLITLLKHIQQKKFDNDFKYAFTSIARSFLYRLSDEEIFIYVTQNNEKKSLIYQDLEPLIGQIKTSSSKEIIMSILEATHFYQKLITYGNILETTTRIDTILNMANDVNLIHYDIYHFEEFLEELLKRDEKIKFSIGTGSSNTVAIMNIHKSKGLEFPICYYCGLYKKFSKKDFQGDILYESGFPISVPFFKDGITDSIVKLLIKDKVEKEDISEKIRLFYVALTRAREKIIILLPQKEKKEERKNCEDVIQNSIRYKYCSFEDILDSIPDEINYYKKNVIFENLHLTKDYLIIKSIKQKNKTEEIKLKINPISIKKEIIENKSYAKEISTIISLEDKKNIELGIVFHETLEWLDFKNPNLDLIDNKFIKAKIVKFLKEPLLKDKEKAQILQEYEFIYDEQEIEYHGIIDLLLIYEDHIDLIDYKLKRTSEKAYLKQLQGYKHYVSSIYNLPIHTYLYSILENKFIELDV